MLRLPQFRVLRPATIKEAIGLLDKPGSRVIGGGTDILPNLKHKLDEPEQIIDLSHISEIGRITTSDDTMTIGSGVKLTDIAESEDVQKYFPSLAKAAGIVASPSIRNMATIGGNIHLDVRCRYVNQTQFWRSAIGGCLKSEGDVCHVVKGGQNCVAAMSSDCVPVLVTLEAVVVLASPRGERQVPISEYYNNDGTNHINKQADEIMTHLELPMPLGLRRCTYTKWSVRQNIDFPLVSIALRFDINTDDTICAAKICVGVLNASPRQLKGLEKLEGQTLSSPECAEQVAELVFKQCKPLGNVPYEPAYRRRMLRVYARRAVESLKP